MLRSGISLIQGPPGTGKTYCGALAVKILLENHSQWDSGENNPIIIVCQTNHALDQFLEHILTFTKQQDIVRIGGRSRHEILQQLVLPKQKIDFNWKEFYEHREQLRLSLFKIFNFDSKFLYSDFQEQHPEICNSIIDEFLLKQDLIFKEAISEASRELIIQLWMKSMIPKQDDVKILLNLESQFQNILIRQPLIKNKSKFQKVFRVDEELDDEFQDIKNQISQQDEDIDENNVLDSDDEEDRKIHLGVYSKTNDIQGVIQNLQGFRQKLKNNYYNHSRFLFIQGNLCDGESPWDLSESDRNLFKYKLWYKNLDLKLEECKEDCLKFSNLQLMIQNQHITKDLRYIQQKKIVGVTVAGFAKYVSKLTDLKYKIMVTEEAAEVLESHTAAIFNQNLEHLILIGDHLQLRPKLESYYLQIKYNTDINNKVPFITLNTQRRMKKQFADFIRLIYDDYNDHKDVELYKNRQVINGVESDLIFFDHNEMETVDQYTASKSNPFEAWMIIKFAEYLNLNKIDYSRMTILTMYMKQALLIKSITQTKKIRIRVQTVDNYQGEENDIIFLSLVRANKDYKLGFVGMENRLCVALSRARIGLYIFGNFTFIYESIIRQQNYYDLWQKVIKLAVYKKIIQQSIKLSCDLHHQITEVTTIQDWDLVERGGCLQPCKLKFSCGHICIQQCHRSEHLRQNCYHKCENQFSCGHYCQAQCSIQPCPDCQVIVERQLQCRHIIHIVCSHQSPPCNQQVTANFQCGHTANVICSKLSTYQCPVRVTRLLTCGHQMDLQCFIQEDPLCEKPYTRNLSCGHPCQLKCGSDCSLGKCFEPQQVKLPCGHQKSFPCIDSRNMNKLVCDEPCNIKLPCGHKCNSTCGICMIHIHPPCTQKTKKILPCQHVQEGFCGFTPGICNKNCQYCPQGQQFQCSHKCIQQKIDKKYKCIHLISWEHLYSQKPCDRECKEILSCGCQCQGLCGQECPQVCFVEQHIKQQVINLKQETRNLKLPKFYQLECPFKHIFEVSQLDNYYADQLSDRKSKLILIRCPECQQIVTRSSRYAKYIDQAFSNFESIKEEQRKLDNSAQILVDLEQSLDKIKLKDYGGYLLKIEKWISQAKVQQSLQITGYHCFQQLVAVFSITKSFLLVEISNEEYTIQKQVILNQYLINQEFPSLYNVQFWKLLTSKLQIMELYQYIVLCCHFNKDKKSKTLVNSLAKLALFINDQHFWIDSESLNNVIQQFAWIMRMHLSKIYAQFEIYFDQNQEFKIEDPANYLKWAKCENGHYIIIGNISYYQDRVDFNIAQVSCSECK